ncbi:MAG TPA: hypothetical protein DD456_00270, partial [Stenotrophomonas sp.]|nr:hypothetical protein [Stenotrophomonas sp.]
MNAAAPASPWSAQQQAWLQAMGYAVYLEGGALDAPLPQAERTAAPAAVDAAPAPAPVAPRAAPPPRREVSARTP